MHNKQFVENGISNVEIYSDWCVVAIFYAALHIVDAKLSEEANLPASAYSTHEKRKKCINKIDSFQKLSIDT